MRQPIVPISILVTAVLMPTPAHAYLDPGLASLLLQGVVGGIAATVAALHVYRARLTALFSRRRERRDPSESDE
jgi:hypothetical protein